MQDAVPVGVGAMAAVMGVDRESLEQICQQAAAGEIVAPANFNSPGQIVIAGHATAVERAIVLAKEQGAKRAMLLPVSAPFHSALMKPAAERLEEILAPLEIAAFSCPVVGNVGPPNVYVRCTDGVSIGPLHEDSYVAGAARFAGENLPGVRLDLDVQLVRSPALGGRDDACQELVGMCG